MYSSAVDDASSVVPPTASTRRISGDVELDRTPFRSVKVWPVRLTAIEPVSRHPPAAGSAWAGAGRSSGTQMVAATTTATTVAHRRHPAPVRSVSLEISFPARVFTSPT